MRGFDPMIMTTRGDKIDDVISTQVRALHRFTLLCLQAWNIALEENPTYSTVACTGLIPYELYMIAFMIFRNGQELLPEAVRPLHHPLSIPKIAGLPTALRAIPYRYRNRSFSQSSSQTS
jgi:hypothetical protein